MARSTALAGNGSGTRSRPWARTVAAVGVAGLVLAACGGEDGDGEGSSDGDGGTAGAGSGGDCDLAADYPSGPIEMIVPWAAGGGTDSVARLVGEQLSTALDTQVNVVNRTGGSGVVGHQAIADAEPDGQTLGLITVEIGMMHHQGLTDLTHEDLSPIAQVNFDPAGLTVAADAPWDDAQALLDHIEANPGTLTASGTGQGGIWHVALIGMLLEAGLEPDAVTFVPSDGAAPALQELVAGGIDLSPSSLGENYTMLEAGRVKALAAMAAEGDPNFPDVPPLAEETGIEFEMGAWRGVAGPAGLDENIVAEVECHLEGIVQGEEYASFMADSRLGVQWRNAEEFAQFMAEDDAAKGEIMERAGLAQ
ncbi:tripartite tricarboxylate transporter substrate binding protein [Ornithinicoccus halotolerans]|uniref:tripartite tricarboxylate transporter substrate binding protein n=1 Tax=Ornithinicoccus halotolerans TaxID=1748220 RepID=UPI001E62F849|nr:tripartite tricarboxylate transporter substrate binding protein [Ornithinicoccus halotolerans]